MRNFIISIMGVALLCAAVISCDKIDNGGGLSDSEIVEGLKTALQVGTDSAVKITSVVDGYFKDQAIKILLPPEAKVITDNVATIDKYSSELGVTLTPYVNNAVHAMNRAAEYAADSAKPILKNAITSLSITDGLSILNGTNPASSGKKRATAFDSTAATNYMKSTTYTSLVRAYKTPVDGELNKDLGLGFSTNQAWSGLTSAYNQAADAAALILSADILNLLPADKKTSLQAIKPIQDITLGQYVTEKALDGLFLKVGNQERSIRRDPWQWISDTVGSILQKVFGKQ